MHLKGTPKYKLSPSSHISKGRNRDLVRKRNNAIIVRYYFWREIQRRRSDDVFTILSEEEFYLHETTLRRIVRDNLDRFGELKKLKPAANKLNTLLKEFQENQFTQIKLFE